MAHLDFDHRRGRVVLPADVLSGDDREGDVGRVQPVLTLAGRQEPLVENVARVPGHGGSKHVALLDKFKKLQNCYMK